MALEKKMIFSLILSWEFVKMVPIMIVVLIKSVRAKKLKQGGRNNEGSNSNRTS